MQQLADWRLSAIGIRGDQHSQVLFSNTGFMEDHNTIGFLGGDGSPWSCGHYLSPVAEHAHTQTGAHTHSTVC